MNPLSDLVAHTLHIKEFIVRLNFIQHWHNFMNQLLWQTLYDLFFDSE